MRGRMIGTVSLVLIAAASFCAGQTDAGAGQSLGDIARKLRQQKAGVQLSGAAATATPSPSPTPASQPESLADAARRLREKTDADSAALSGDAERIYRAAIRQMFVKRDFAALDAAAAQVRANKERLPGGAWKLLIFYYAIDGPVRGVDASDAEWQAHLSVLKDWIAQRPQSVTARIALAGSYLTYGWKARGSGYSNTISDDGWLLFNERMQLAAQTLVEAYKLPEKCPYWYELMQAILRTEGLDKQKMRDLFDHAVAFEPDFYHFYQEQATYLLPKWGGEPGDAEGFAEETYKRVGGKEGAFLYFSIAATIYCDCANEPKPMQLSWKVIQEGYEYMNSKYGTNNLKENQMALLAFQAGDRKAAHDLFAQIGDAWNHETWRSKSRFEQVKAWAQ